VAHIFFAKDSRATDSPPKGKFFDDGKHRAPADAKAHCDFVDRVELVGHCKRFRL
jgi:hypothetical protein